MCVEVASGIWYDIPEATLCPEGSERNEARTMNGLMLSQAYFIQYGLPMIEKRFGAYKDRIAAGLVGEGSECYGFDDDISRDHDWGPAFCLWLEAEDYLEIGPDLQKAYDELPESFMGIRKRAENPLDKGRIGVLHTPTFFKRFTGLDHVPETMEQWRTIPEDRLSAATNGQVFYDPLGKFTSFRNRLKAYYPEDIRLKKIAARCMTMAQAGQYNYLRCLRHGEKVAAQYALSLFIGSSISMVFLLNKEYMPFYKWMHRAVKGLPILGGQIYGMLNQLSDNLSLADDARVRNSFMLVEDISGLVIEELKRQSLSDSASDFLFDHGPVVQMKIQTDWLRRTDVMKD